jgi:hypothetical protein
VSCRHRQRPARSTRAPRHAEIENISAARERHGTPHPPSRAWSRNAPPPLSLLPARRRCRCGGGDDAIAEPSPRFASWITGAFGYDRSSGIITCGCIYIRKVTACFWLIEHLAEVIKTTKLHRFFYVNNKIFLMYSRKQIKTRMPSGTFEDFRIRQQIISIGCTETVLYQNNWRNLISFSIHLEHWNVFIGNVFIIFYAQFKIPPELINYNHFHIQWHSNYFILDASARNVMEASICLLNGKKNDIFLVTENCFQNYTVI